MAKIAPAQVNVDPVSFLVYGLSAVLFISTAKLVAFRYHGHPLAQATLILL